MGTSVAYHLAKLGWTDVVLLEQGSLSGGTTFVTSDLANPQINISYGCYYLRYLLARYDQNEVAALAAYNAGTGNVDKWGGADLGLEDIRFPETQGYVEEVLDKRQEYRDKYAEDLGIGR